MWDEPSAEVTQLKKQCEMMLENYEDDIESWYFSNQGLYFKYLVKLRSLLNQFLYEFLY